MFCDLLDIGFKSSMLLRWRFNSKWKIFGHAMHIATRKARLENHLEQTFAFLLERQTATATITTSSSSSSSTIIAVIAIATTTITEGSQKYF